jgi:hypothetical protein
MSVFVDYGVLVVETDVDLAVIKILRKWLPTYLSAAETDRSLANGLLARPVDGSFANTIEDDEFVDHQLPAIIVTTAQTADAPVKAGNGSYAASWTVVVSSVVRGRTAPETRAVAALFSGCVRRALTQQESLEGFAGGVEWIGSSIAPVPDVTNAGRYLAAGVNTFVVHTDAVLDSYGGPQVPAPYGDDPDPTTPDEPYDPLASVGDVSISVTQRQEP